MGNSLSCPGKEEGQGARDPEGSPSQGSDGYWRKVGDYCWEQWPLSLANTMDWYEFAIYSNMEPYISQTFFGNSDAITWAVFSISFVSRIFGGLVFGTIADRFGRRPAVLGTLTLMCCATVGQGITPAVGYFGPAWLITCRIMQGLGAGGEVGSVSVFMAEESHTSILAMSGVLNNSGSQVGFALSSLTSALLLSTLGNDRMMSWGWRVPFLFVLIPGTYTIHAALSMHETSAFRDVQDEQGDEPWQMSHQVTLIEEHWTQGVLAIAGAANGLVIPYLAGSYLQQWLVTYCGTDQVTAFWVILGNQLLTIPMGIPFGWYGDHYGLGKSNALGAGIALVTGVPMYAALLYYPNSLAVLLIAGVLIPGFIQGAIVAQYPFVSTLFPTEVRATGFSLCYNVAGLTGGLAPAICTAANTPLYVGYYTTVFAALSLAASCWAIHLNNEYVKHGKAPRTAYLREDIF